MIWQSWSDFFEMGGYGLYVWGSFVVIIGCMGGEVLLLTLRWNALVKRLARWLKRTEHENQA